MRSPIQLHTADNVPYLWGFDDALEGLRPRPAHYFGADSPQWQEYEAGYLAGVEHVFCSPSGCPLGALRVALPSERPADLLVDQEAPNGFPHREQRF